MKADTPLAFTKVGEVWCPEGVLVVTDPSITWGYREDASDDPPGLRTLATYIANLLPGAPVDQVEAWLKRLPPPDRIPEVYTTLGYLCREAGINVAWEPLS
jgi:hypothetical protein